jgi:hypothetical protein
MKYDGVTHNEMYDVLQTEYLETRDSKTLGKMYKIAKNVAQNYIKKYCVSHGLRHLDIDEASHDASLFVIEQYLRKPEFNVKKISAYVYFGVKKALFKNKDVEMRETSYDEMIEKGEVEWLSHY